MAHINKKKRIVQPAKVMLYCQRGCKAAKHMCEVLSEDPRTENKQASVCRFLDLVTCLLIGGWRQQVSVSVGHEYDRG